MRWKVEHKHTVLLTSRSDQLPLLELDLLFLACSETRPYRYNEQGGHIRILYGFLYQEWKEQRSLSSQLRTSTDLISRFYMTMHVDMNRNDVIRAAVHIYILILALGTCAYLTICRLHINPAGWPVCMRVFREFHAGDGGNVACTSLVINVRRLDQWASKKSAIAIYTPYDPAGDFIGKLGRFHVMPLQTFLRYRANLIPRSGSVRPESRARS